jgi:prepilin-type N-terminal cleavage/methylation domain-containing protein/prepilin-type processing-associated H-X9-DG protein
VKPDLGKHVARGVPVKRERHRRAFTLVELLVVIAVILLLATLLLPALDAASASVKRVYCLNNLRQIGLGMAAYMQDHDTRLPPICHFTTEQGRENWSWDVPLRFYLDISPVEWPPDAIKLLVCPADATWRWPDTPNTFWWNPENQRYKRSYAFNMFMFVYGQGIWIRPPEEFDMRNWGQAYRASEITDGLANTIAFVEWHTLENSQYNTSACAYWTFCTLQPNHPGATMLYCDGHARYCPDTLAAPAFRDMTPKSRD